MALSGMSGLAHDGWRALAGRATYTAAVFVFDCVGYRHEQTEHFSRIILVQHSQKYSLCRKCMLHG